MQSVTERGYPIKTEWSGSITFILTVFGGADVNNPLARVDTGSDLKVNPIVELCEAMRIVQQVLSDYLRFGSPNDVMDLMETIN